MRNFMQNFSYKLQNFMQGRYGRDELTTALNAITILFIILALFKPLSFFIYLALALIIWTFFRMLSRNRSGRVKELNIYYKVKNTVTGKFRLYRSMWRDRNTHLYCKCPNCKTMVRIKKPAKGKTIRINCPKCKNSFEKRT